MSLTPAMRAQLQSVDDVDGLLLLAVLDDPVLSASVHVVNDTRDWPDIPTWSETFQRYENVTYIGIPMQVTLPTDVAGQASQAQLEISNVGRELTAELEALPLGSNLDVTLRIVSRAAPEQIEWEYEAAIGRVTATVPRVVIVLGDDTLLRQSAVLLRFDPTTAPGLFAG
jgi:hypothetical protein